MRLEQDPRGEPATARLNYTTHRLGRALDRFCENLALAHGVTLSQFLVLQVLAEGLPMTNAQLARRTFSAGMPLPSSSSVMNAAPGVPSATGCTTPSTPWERASLAYHWPDQGGT